MTLNRYELITQRFFKPKMLFILVIELVLLSSHFFIPENVLLCRLICGIISFIVIPGYLVFNSLRKLGLLPIEGAVGFSLLFGFSIQTLIITFFWGFDIETTYLRLIIAIFTFSIVIVTLLKNVDNVELKFQKADLLSPIFLIIIIAVAVRSLYFIANVSSLGIDGGLYCDFARTIVSDGKFSSNIINDGFEDPFFNVKGFSSSPLTIFSVATFFFFGDTSYASAKLAVFFIGILVVFLIYQLSYDMFGKDVAIIAGLISAIFPLLSYYSSILYGPEILSTLFVLSSTYFFIRGVKVDCDLGNMILSGLFAVFVHGAWRLQAFIPLLVTFVSVFIIYKIKEKKLCFYALFLMTTLFFTYRLSAIPFVQIFLITISLVCLFVIFIHKMKINLCYKGITVFVVTIIVGLQLFFIKSYLDPQMFIVPTTEAFMQNPTEVINPFSLTYGLQTGVDHILKTFTNFWASIASILNPLIFGLSIASFFVPIQLKEKIIVLMSPLITSALITLSLPEYVVWSESVFPDRFLISSVCFMVILSAVTLNSLLNVHKKLKT